MSKKIVVITGSPRKKGNSLSMTEAFIEAAAKNGHSVIRFDAAQSNVGAATLVKLAIIRERLAVLMMILIKLQRIFFKQI